MGARVVAQAASSDPAAVAEIIRAASPILGALIALIGVIFSLRQNGRREDARMKNERENKEMELEAAHESRLRDERIASYRKLLAATVHAPTERKHSKQIALAYAEVELIAGSADMAHAAKGVWTRYGRVQNLGQRLGRDPSEEKQREWSKALTAAMDYRDSFLDLAKKELGIDWSEATEEEEG